MMPDLRGVGFAEMRGRIIGNRLEVYSRLLAHGPATCTELASVMGWDKCSVRPRISELCDLSHAVGTGNRRNGEHEFAALGASDAERAHAALIASLTSTEDRPAPSPMAQEIARHAKEIQTGFFL